MKKFILYIFSIFAFNFAIAQDYQKLSNTGDLHQTANNDTSLFYINKNDASFYPNPVINNKFVVKATNIIKSVEIFNVIGRTIHKQKNKLQREYMKIELDNCEKGMYLVKITFQDNKSIIKKILVK